MASSLKNISALLSPRFRSPLTPTSSVLRTPKSDGNRYNFLRINRNTVAKKLDFSDQSKAVSKFSKNAIKTTNILPVILIEKESENIHEEFGNTDKIPLKDDGTLDINTPNKLDLAKNGLEHFRNTRVLGKGTFGTVFRGKHRGQTVAVKIVNKDNCLREENALRLSHKNIVTTLEIIRNLENQSYCLIIMEYLANCKNLQDVLETIDVEHDNSSTENLSKLLKKFCLDVTAGLDHCHKNGVLHLDLKPKNILVNSENDCKICDFGNSTKIEETLDSSKHNGTIVYTAPEILMGKKPSIKSDVYSLGLIFWQIKYRRNPFQDYDTNESVIYNVGKFDVRPTYEDKNTDILTNIFKSCWQSDPALRPNTAQILKDLEGADF